MDQAKVYMCNVIPKMGGWGALGATGRGPSDACNQKVCAHCADAVRLKNDYNKVARTSRVPTSTDLPSREVSAAKE